MPKDPCSDLAKTFLELALNVGARDDVHTLADVVREIQKDIPELNRDVLVASINEATAGVARASSELSKKLEALKREAKTDKALRERIDALKEHLDAGTLPDAAGKKPGRAAEIETLAKERDGLLKQLRQSEPALRKKYETQIQNLTDRLEGGVFTKPAKGASSAASKSLERLEYERDKLRTQVRRRIQQLKPKTIWGHTAEPLNAARAIMTSYDVSAVLRQGGFVALSHPILTAKAFPEMFRALRSDEAAWKAAKELDARENAPLYKRAGLFLSDVGSGGLSKQEERFVSKIAGKVPGVRPSERAYVTFLNRIRADLFDALERSLTTEGAAYDFEAKTIANYVNNATGRAKLPGHFEAAADAMNTVFFAPRYVTSRFNMLTGQPMWHGTAATRKIIAKEYARYLAGVGVVLGLGALAGGKIGTDPSSSEFGKLKFGNTRVDPFSGFGSLVTLGYRTVSGVTTTGRGQERSLVDTKFGEDDVGDLWTSFMRYKFSPPLQLLANLATRKNAVGKPTTPLEAVAETITPLTFGEVYEELREQGFPKGAAFALLSMFGASSNTYDATSRDRKSHFEKDVRHLWEAMKD